MSLVIVAQAGFAATASATDMETIFAIGEIAEPTPDSFLEVPTTSSDPRDLDFVCSDPDTPAGGKSGQFIVGETPQPLFPALLRSSNASAADARYSWSCSEINVVFESRGHESVALELARSGGEETAVYLNGLLLGTQIPVPFRDPHPMMTYTIDLGSLGAGTHILTIAGTQRPTGADGFGYFGAMRLTGTPVPASAPTIATLDVATAVLGTASSVSATLSDIDSLDGTTCDVDWGDASTATKVDVSEGQCLAEHTYAMPGDYTVTVTATDATGLTGSDSTTATVYSTESSVAANGRLDGAVLNVSARYDKGGGGTGRVSYRETPKGLTVESESVDLVLVTSTTARVEGAASLNGMSGHHYVVSFDLDANTVQVVVTDPDGAVVLDSGIQELSKGGVQAKAG